MSAYQQAVRLLARRSYGEQELRQRLLRSDLLSRDEVDSAIDRCRAVGYLDDRRFVDQRIRHRFDQGYGPDPIRAELRQCGIADLLITEVMQELLLQFPVVMVARALWQRRLRGSSYRDDVKKQYAFLRRRGFDHETVCHVLADRADTEEFEDR
ncbi:MAG: regulatory protein RecX [Magnetococcales bacterium]|nr:regulatory protein RecX [Magnetococcales bacterium]